MNIIKECHNAGISSYTFENGFKLILAHYKTGGQAHVQLVVKVGSKHENYGETGMAHLLEHMLFKSTLNISSVKDKLEYMSLSWNGNTSCDRTVYYEVVKSDNVIDAINLEYERLLHSTFTEEILKTEMTVVRNEMERGNSDPSSSMYKAMINNVFTTHGYRHPTIGARSDIEKAPFQVLWDFYKKFYNASNSFLFISGSFDKDKVIEEVSKLFGSEPKMQLNKFEWTEEDSFIEGSSIQTIKRPAGKSSVWLGWLGPKNYTKEHLGLTIGLNAIGQEPYGVAYQHFVNDTHQLTNFQSYIIDCVDYSIPLFICDALNHYKSNDIYQNVEEYLFNCIDKELYKYKIEEAINQYKALYNNTSTEWSSLHYLFVDAELSGDWQLSLRYREYLETLTTEQVVEAVNKYIKSQTQRVILLDNDTPVQNIFENGQVDLTNFESYPSIIVDSDNVYSSYIELNQDINTFKFGHLSLNVLQRKNQDGFVHVNYSNRIGNEDYKKEFKKGIQYKSMLRELGGAGYSKSDIESIFNKCHAKLQWSTDGFSIYAGPEHINSLLTLMIKVFHNPHFKDFEFQSFKNSYISHLNRNMTNVSQLALKNMLQTLNHDFSKDDLNYIPSFEESLESISNYSYEDALKDIIAVSKVGDIYMTIIGHIDTQTYEFLQKEYCNLYPQYTHDNIPTVRKDYNIETIQSNTLKVKKGIDPNSTVYGIVPISINDNHPDCVALDILNYILGGSMSSRITNKIREEKGLAYQVYSKLNLAKYDSRSYLMLCSSCDSINLEETYNSLVQEYTDFLINDITDNEISSAIHNFKEYHFDTLSSDNNYMGLISQNTVLYRDVLYCQKQQDILNNINKADLLNTIYKYLKDAPVIWSIGTKE